MSSILTQALENFVIDGYAYWALVYNDICATLQKGQNVNLSK
jgi:hypothetical protein